MAKATATSSEFEPEAQQRGFSIIARANEVALNFARICIVTIDKILATRRDAVIRFLAVNMEGTAYAMANRAKTVALSRTAAKLSPDDTSPEFIFDEATAQKNIDPNLAIPADKLQWIEAVLAKNGTVDTNADIKAFIDDAPRQAALKIVKP